MTGRQLKTTRARGFIEWQPRQDTMTLIDAVRGVLDEYRAVLPLTIRQIFYRLVAEQGYDKTELAYNRLTETIGKARRARLIAMDCIRDDGFFLSSIQSFAGAQEVMDTYRQHSTTARMDRQVGQARRLMVWCEAQGMKPMLEGVTIDYGVPVASSGGFDSITAKYEMAKAFAGDGLTEVLHIGDYDPSGVHMFSSLDEDIAAFIECLGGQVEFTRLAVTPDQRDSYRLPTAPPKKTDRRSFADINTVQCSAVQCEALRPDILLGIVEAAIIDRLDMDAYRAVLLHESAMRVEVGALLTCP